MKLNVYENQNEVEKTYEAEAYDIMYGTVEDILDVLDDVTGDATDEQLIKAITKNREKLNALLKDVFPGITDGELRRTKVKELVPLFMELFTFLMESVGFGDRKN